LFSNCVEPEDEGFGPPSGDGEEQMGFAIDGANEWLSAPTRLEGRGDVEWFSICIPMTAKTSAE
jgi:hypothetical protein